MIYDNNKPKWWESVLITGTVLLLVGVLMILTGCSHAQFRESYDGNGNLASREVRSTNALNWIESQFAAEQGAGVYNLGMGTRGGVDPAVERTIMQLAVTGLAYGGMSQLRRAGQDSAFGPVSVDGLGGGGLAARPITAEQQAALADNNARRVEIENIRAERDRLREERDAAQAEAAAAHQMLEAATRPPAQE